ncbi:MAG TPA: hypothetical protein VGS08_04135 [Candidatus Saccharimonadales bacterium]|nr:hypothetical protein [Candidatus Saccharimonadales bacterium]
MNALFLPGASNRNRQWIHAFAEQLGSLFDVRVVCEYQSWDQVGAHPDELIELPRITSQLKDLPTPYVVVAKSVGTYFALRLIRQGVLQPTRCVFLGAALGLLQRAGDADELVSANSVPTLILQNRHDPVASFTAVQSYLASRKLNNYRAVELPSETHDYIQYDLMQPLIQDFLAS